MGGNVERVKERIDIVEVVGNYVKLEKAGTNFKGRCPFHNEKTASFFVSPSRQSFNCFGCGERGDVFTFVEKQEGLDFKEALKFLADKAGVELTYERHARTDKTERDALLEVLEVAGKFFMAELGKHPEVVTYILSRGLTEESIKSWKIGYAPDEWRALYSHLTALGYAPDLLIRAGLAKKAGEDGQKNPYDVFRGRVIFPLFDQNGRIIAFSGRALDPNVPAKYLNSPETPVFQKSEVLYGLDKAKDDIRRKNYAVLVEGQMDLVLSHQAGVANTVASSGTAFTSLHLERLKRFSDRIILAFDGDKAGQSASEKSAMLALALGMEVKIARLPEGKDPADLVREDSEKWKEVLRGSKHAFEVLLEDILTSEKDPRKAGKEINRRILPLLAFLTSAIEKAHFVSLISQRSGIREDVLWEDVKRAKAPDVHLATVGEDIVEDTRDNAVPLRERIVERLTEIALWQKELGNSSPLAEAIEKEERELRDRLGRMELEEERNLLKRMLREGTGDEEVIRKIETLNRRLDEEKRKMV
jgi:DNA primase